MNSTNTVSVDTISNNRNGYVFCTIPKWAKTATVDFRGNVLKWNRK